MCDSPVIVYSFRREKHTYIEQLRKAVVKDERGKPWLKPFDGKFISISHSGDYFAVALADCPVGMDLQRWDMRDGPEEAVRRYRQIAERYFHPAERDWIMHADLEFLQAFFRIWAAKESFVKYTGRGLDDDFGNFSVVGEELCPNVYFWHGQRNGYSMAVCTEKKRKIIWQCI